MKNGQRSFLFLFGLLWIACAAPPAGAQQDNVPITKKRVNTTIVDRNQRQREVQVTDKSRVNTEPPIEPNSIRVRIRYQKEYGYLTSNKPGNQEPYSCSAFAVDASVWSGEPGTFGRPKTGNELNVLMTIIGPPELMRVDSSYYVCDFTITSVPLNEPIIVSGSMINNSRVLTGRWREGSQPQPPPGSERLILNGKKNVRLTKSEPSATVDFEMVYRPIQLPPR
jgi:hypothetical protein